MKVRHVLLPALVCLGAPLGAQDQRAEAMGLVKAAVAFARQYGKDALRAETNQGTGRFHSRSGDDLYIFVYDLGGVCQAIGFQSQLVGVNRLGLRDPDGKYIVKEMIEVARSRGSGWVNYKYPHPRTGKVLNKVSYVEFFDGWVVGCGAYS
ncbi:cache domain-containing protein [Geothrix sp. 21YS21S-4]|uniref:cache domain-containing protein n=1 Tax=Geothrix sp. 21YS21S-4 TaxID=3068889 RepID=UPI0027B919A8|nr:cache domain-containing protein [Geothrix sp. 21YS21S-4]